MIKASKAVAAKIQTEGKLLRELKSPTPNEASATRADLQKSEQRRNTAGIFAEWRACECRRAGDTMPKHKRNAKKRIIAGISPNNPADVPAAKIILNKFWHTTTTYKICSPANRRVKMKFNWLPPVNAIDNKAQIPPKVGMPILKPP